MLYRRFRGRPIILPLLWLVLLPKTVCSGYEAAWNPGYRTERRVISQEVMVDVVNHLGVKLLAIHNEHNENNIAISPYGALSVLVALGEGLRGSAVHEIQHAAHIPGDISVIRVGLRDIHRHLKSYFIPKEGFLAGLTLNHENVSLNREYEDILKFYGYDVDSFNNALYPDPYTTEKPSFQTLPITTSTPEETTTPSPEKEGLDGMPGTEITTSSIITTPLMETTTEGSKRTTTVEMTTISPMTTTKVTETTGTTIQETTLKTTVTPTTTSTEAVTTFNTSVVAITGISTTTSAATEATIPVSNTLLPTTTVPRTTTVIPTTVTAKTLETNQPQTKPVVTTSETTTKGSTTIITTTEQTTTRASPTEPQTTATSIIVTTEQTTTTASPTEPQTTQTSISTTSVTLTPAEVMANVTPLPLSSFVESTTAAAANVLAFGDQPQNFNVISEDAATLSPPIFVPEDASESINEDYGSIPEYSLEDQIPPENLDVDGNTNFVTEENLSTEDNAITQAATDDISTMTLQTAAPPSNINTDNLNVEEDSRENFIAKDKRSAKFRSRNNRTSRSVVDYIIARYYDDHYIPPRPTSYIPEEHLTFLVHGKYREPNISFMKYDTVLPFHYIPHLNTLALSFPLDSTKYYLLLLLPVSERGVDQLICDLRMHGNLRYIIENLRYTHVVATIPSFTLKGYVNLTPTFQKLGIKKVFEPRQADFSPMTEQTEIYVTNIEQAVTVTIRNYVDPSTMNSHRNLHEFGIVQFKADHPFLYFVMDAEIHVTLMAGKIVNPLNARIR